jgi:hypothetical protein
MTRPSFAALWQALVRDAAAEVIRQQNEQPSSPSGLLAVSKAAKQVGRTPRTVKNWGAAGLIKLHRINGHLYVNAQAWSEFLAKSDGRRRRSTLKVA